MLTESIDASRPIGRMLMQGLGSFAEFERDFLFDGHDVNELVETSFGRLMLLKESVLTLCKYVTPARIAFGSVRRKLTPEFGDPPSAPPADATRLTLHCYASTLALGMEAVFETLFTGR